MSRRARQRQSAAESHYYQPGPDDESDSEGGEPDAVPAECPACHDCAWGVNCLTCNGAGRACHICGLVGTHKLQCPERGEATQP